MNRQERPQQRALFGPTPAGEIGIQRSHEHAERDEPGWTERAAAALFAFAKRTAPADFTIEQARAAVEPVVGAPVELRAWGAVTQRALRRRWIERVDFRRTHSSNGTFMPTYRAGGAA